MTTLAMPTSKPLDLNARGLAVKLGESFAHVHHVGSLAERGVSETRMDDLAIVCANCHAMIHRNGVTRTLEEVRPSRTMPRST